MPGNDANLTAPSGQEQRHWYALPAAVALAALEADDHGLATTEAEARLERLGPNKLPTAAGRGPLVRFLLQFHNLLIYVLLVAAVLAAALGETTDATVIMAVVVVNAVIGFVQEGRAERALEAIRGMIDPKASVLRDGRRQTVDADEIVPGDVVLIEAGDRVPADLRLFKTKNLRIEEAILTGESVAVEKQTEPVVQQAALGDRTSMAFSGTFVAAGQGAGVAVSTAVQTELGRISTLLGSVQSLKTPLIHQMDRFAKQVTLVVLAISAIAFVAAYASNAYGLADAFMIVVGLAVAAIPEGLPAIMTITLAIGVTRMAKRHAIVRRLPAVETLGSVSVICSDKTGTLTRNEMTVQMVVTAACTYEATGVGYDPTGSFRVDAGEVSPGDGPALTEIVQAGLLCNDAELHQAEGVWRIDGDSMEGALLTLAAKAGLDASLVRKQLPRTDEIPFDAAHRFMATLHHSHTDGSFILIKGAPERVIDMCATERGPAGDFAIDRSSWARKVGTLAARGQRVLAFARKPARQGQQDLTFDDVATGATLLGLMGFIDPPRDEAIAAVSDCRAAGIRVVMITGDHAVTAREIARQLGLSDDPKTLTGTDLESLDEQGLRHAVRETTVFARTTPEHKLRLVEALQSEGLTVAMTGDGVNDAPALKRADVGVAMGSKGTEVAKQAAEVVLADDNFASIVAAVREGRTVYDNIVKVIGWTLPTNGGEAVTILAAIALGLALPITPAQILWVNMVTAVALGLTLAFEPTEHGTMRRPPRPRTQPLLGAELVWRIAFVSALFVAGTFGMFFWAEERGLPIETARTIVVNTLVVMEVFYLFSVRYVHGTSLTLQGVLGTPAVLVGVSVVVVAQLLLTYTSFLQRAFGTQPLSFLDGAAIIGVGIALLVAVEIEKAVRRAL
jgi:magnesium-transporting ATPase (P-type)